MQLIEVVAVIAVVLSSCGCSSGRSRSSTFHSRCQSSECQRAQGVDRMQLRVVVAMIVVVAVVAVVVEVVEEVVEEVLLVTRDVKARNTSALKGLTECNLWSRDCNIFVK